MTAAPDWLTTRDVRLQVDTDGNTVQVLFSGSPQYKLIPTPAKGGHTCAVIQCVNGRRLDKEGGIHRTRDEALQGGLDTLRTALGW